MALVLARSVPMGAAGATVLGWAGVRGVVTLALALSLPEDFPGRDFIHIFRGHCRNGSNTRNDTRTGYRMGEPWQRRTRSARR